MKRRLRSINFILMFVMCFGALGFMPKIVTAQDRAVGMGDLAIILYNGDDPDSLAFVALVDLAEGEVIRFTDSGWYVAGGFRASEGGIAYTVPTGGITAGTIVSRDNPFSSGDWSVNNSGVGTSGFALAVAGDQIITFQGDAASPSLIYALNNEGAGIWQADATNANTSALPTGLTNGTTAIAIDEIDNARLKCTSELSGSKAELLAYISDKGNWEGSDTVRQSLDGNCSFTIVTVPTDTAPEVSSTTPVDSATKVALDSNIGITFSEAVTLAADWYEIDCSVSGLHTATVDESADPIIVLDPASDFVLGDVCEVTVFAAKVTDDDTIDPPDTMAENYIFTFKTLLSPKINEFSASTTGTDVEYIEIFGDPDTDYSAYTLLEIEGDFTTSSAVEGYIDEVIAIGTTDANGFYLGNLAANALENGTITLLLVKDFSGAFEQDLDTNDDGTFEFTPWSAIIDSVAVHDGGTSDLTYGTPVLGVAYDGLQYAPGGASRIPDGYDTESATDWVRNNFALVGIPGSTGTIVLGEAYNTPGTTNIAYTPPPEMAPTVTLTSPTNGATAIATDTNIEITFSEPVTVTAPWFSISCATSGIHTATVTDADPKFTLDPAINFVPNEVCTVTVLATGVNDDDTDDSVYDYMEADYVFSFTTGEACGDAFTPTYTIQGSGATSPLVGSTIAVEGVVVGDFTTGAYVSGGKNGFYIQDPTGDDDPNTSDGLFIYSNLKDVQVGDHVRVAGKVVEYVTGSSSLTQLNPVTQIWTCDVGQVVAPTKLSLPVAADFDYEDYEGMLVTYEQALVISEYFEFDRYGSIVLTSKRNLTPTAQFEPGSPEYFAAVQANLLDRITLDDSRTSQNPDPAIHPNGAIFDLTNLFRGGSTLTDVTGILDSYSSLYRIQLTQGATYTDTNPRTIAPDVEPGDLTVASFNVLNYFLDIDDGVNDDCGPSGDMECRGADTELELERQRAKILAAMSGIEADIFGLMEIQNDTGASTADLVAGLNTIFGADTYDYIDTGYIGTDAIKQAIIYKPAAVTPVGDYEILDSSVDPRFIDTANRPVLAQVFEDKITGETFVVAVNHLKSKGSACAGDPDLGDGQGNCPMTRKAAAEALVDWLADATIFPDTSNALIIGDLNAYDKEDPIDMIKLGADDLPGTDDDFIDMVAHFQGEAAYGYVYDGQVGYLDHALANNSLADNIVDVNFWHINADEADLIDYNMDFKADAQDAIYAPDAYRSSDHDPVIVTLTLNHAPVATPDAYLTDEDVAIQALAPGVLANDTDVNPNDTLTAELVTDVTSGVLVLNADGSFTYTPALNFFGEVTFTYRVFDGKVYSNTVTVTITVAAVNDSPVAEDDLYETDQDKTLVVPAPGVLENDSDPDPGDMFTVVLMTPTQHGTVVLQADGSFTYTPAPGFSGTDTFIYALISMARGGYADTATVTITVHPVYRFFLPLIVR